jgi:hypothetical protein
LSHALNPVRPHLKKKKERFISANSFRGLMTG